MFFPQGPYICLSLINPWLLQLGDVTKGLIYMHDQGMVHGNPTGVGLQAHSHCPAHSLPNPKKNILIDNNGHACLAGFGLYTQTLDQPTIGTSEIWGGPSRWMSPEHFLPQEFGLKDGCPAKESDCYALGMTILEVLSGRMPFAEETSENYVMIQVIEDKRPSRPRGTRGAWFTDGLWEMLELCWKRQPGDRPSLNNVLECLQGTRRPSRPPSDVDRDVETDINDQSGAATSDSGKCPLLYPILVINYPCDVIGPPITYGDNGFPDPQNTGNPKKERTIKRWARGARRIIKAATSKVGRR